MKNDLRSAGLPPAVEAASRRLKEREELSVWLRLLANFRLGRRDADRTAAGTAALPGASL